MAAQQRRSVLLLKAADTKYEAAFRALESPTERIVYDIYFADVLSFEYVNSDTLRDTLLDLESYSSILVTSPRAGIAIRKAIEAMDQVARDSVINMMKKSIFFSVGKATTKELECFGITVAGDDCGSADAMAEYIHQDAILPPDASTKPAVFLCGDKRREALPESFRKRQLPIVELAVYKTCAVTEFTLPETCLKPDWVVFFSPSGIKAAQGTAIAWEDVKKAAIGKTTAGALDKVALETNTPSWAADVVADKPTAESIARAIADFEYQTHI